MDITSYTTILSVFVVDSKRNRERMRGGGEKDREERCSNVRRLQVESI